jgi:hypothetical protein
MYIVKVPFSYQNMSGTLINAQVGDEVPDFEQWPYVCQKAHLNMDWVVKDLNHVSSVVELKAEPLVAAPVIEPVILTSELPKKEVKPKKGRSSKK